MKAVRRIVALLVLVVLMVNLVGCYGSFTLTRKLYEWNGSVGDKFINTAVMWVFMILPVYQFAGFIDFVVLNTIEFWTDSNPLAMKDGDQVIKYVTNDGKTYKIITTRNNMTITETAGPDMGKSINLNYSPETGNWIANDGVNSTVIANLKSDNLKLFYPNGESRELELSR